MSSDQSSLEDHKSSSKRTGLVYYENCIEHYCIWDDNYEENPKRFLFPLKRIKELGLDKKCYQINPRKASKEEILSIHSEEYLNRIQSICLSNMSDSQLEKESSKFDSVYFTPNSYDCALYSAGSVLELVDSVMNNRIQNGFALVRPPGHHAMVNEACGYCIFNNVAIAAKYCLKKYHMQKILIIDWDVHHGQGTQRIFYDDDRVFYVSLHRYENGTFWPELKESDYDYTGHEKAKGFNMNIPLNETKLSNADYLAIWHNILMPTFYEFNPDLVLVSSGYDAAIGCPQGEMLLSPSIYMHFTHYLKGLANGKVLVILEGGYCIESLSDSVVATIKTLLGEPPVPIEMQYPLNQTVCESILNVISVMHPYWNVLRLHKTFDLHELTNEDHESSKKHIPVIELNEKAALIEGNTDSYPTRDCYPVQCEQEKKKFLEAIALLREFDLKNSMNYRLKRTCLITFPITFQLNAFLTSHLENPNEIMDTNIIELVITFKEQILSCHSSDFVETIKSAQNQHHKNLQEIKNELDLSSGDHTNRERNADLSIFNNIATAAHYAIKEYKLDKILIVDLDIHHDDGTKNVVENDERILFVSLHRYDNGDSCPKKLGSNLKPNKNIINIPWDDNLMTDKEFLTIFCNIVLPIAYNFGPELVFIRCGFDAAQSDPLGKNSFLPDLYGQVTHLLCSVANGKIIMAIEGDYEPKSIFPSLIECIRVLLGDSPKRIDIKKEPLHDSVIEKIRKVIDYHSTNWPCLAFNHCLPETNV
ncbi:Polyamine deacetylase HDAC10 [Sarcoptes scabiei]|uniref:Histone deacetylase 10 n=1 Tax=Sarcoptes scabiei TaxID=52283 RepID=A0A834VCK7_SARSC|nr:Polyamine deacetylase HDAC10 [Sarcoptes scabiei]